MIIRNRAQCKNCGDVIESVHRHDYVVCSCYKEEIGCTGIMVDGGKDYLRRGGNMDNFIELSELKDETGNKRG